MSKGFIKALRAASVVAILVGISGAAQAAEATFDIPFRFTVNEKTLPPGTYNQTTRARQGRRLGGYVYDHNLRRAHGKHKQDEED
jgi:hypothetical protein